MSMSGDVRFCTVPTRDEVRRRRSASARNRVLNLAERNFPDGRALVTYDDYLCPRGDWLRPALRWLRREDVGVVGAG